MQAALVGQERLKVVYACVVAVGVIYFTAPLKSSHYKEPPPPVKVSRERAARVTRASPPRRTPKLFSYVSLTAVTAQKKVIDRSSFFCYIARLSYPTLKLSTETKRAALERRARQHKDRRNKRGRQRSGS